MFSARPTALLCTLLAGCSAADDAAPVEADASTSTGSTGAFDPSTSSTGTDDDAESSSSGGAGEVSTCDPWSEDACDDGFKCMPYDAAPIELVWDANGCFPVEDDAAQPGDRCEVFESAVDGTDTCVAHAMCMPSDFEDLEAGGVCVAFCEGTAQAPSCAEPSETCAIANDGVLNLCLAMCDPTLQDCADGEGCYLNPTDAKFLCFQQDEAGQNAPSGYGTECGSINFCDPGLQCTDATAVASCAGDYCCTAFCDLDGGDAQCPDAAAGQRCLAHFPAGDEPPGWAHIGICGIPQ